MVSLRRMILVAVLAIGGAITVLAAAWKLPIDPTTHVALEYEPSSSGAISLIRLSCTGCHSNGRAKIDFDGYLGPKAVARDPATWRRVVRHLRSGEMPPPESPRLMDAERACIIEWIEGGLRQAAAVEQGRVLVRRLRQAEYRNAVHDLLWLSELPDLDLPDDEDIGWDRCLSVPDLGAAEQVKYAAAARQIVSAPAASTLSEWAARAPSRDDVQTAVTRLARRAFRRLPTPAELGALMGAYDEALAGGAGEEVGWRALLQALLTSPHFLQRIEWERGATANGAEAADGQFALASRLAYLLWNSIPDDELMDQAEHGTLVAHLPAQTERMLKDPRARRLAEGFASAWLGLDKLEMSIGSAALAKDMRRETEHFVAAIVLEDGSVLDFLDGEYSFINERLANHYGIAGVSGDAFRRVSLAGTPRAGLLTQASVLAAKSTNGRHSPVIRGKWILENLLGTPPLTPPSGLLEAFFRARRDFGPSTARQILERHREQESCAYCHAQMDALGFALENFDAQGAWRTHEYDRPIDVTIDLPTGETLTGPASVRTYLLERKDQFVRCLSEKMLGYALDRKLTGDERRSLDEIPARVAQDGYRFRRLTLEVVTNALFQRDCSLSDNIVPALP